MTETIPTGVTAVRTVAIAVTDQDRALRFYGDLLGCEVRRDVWVEQMGARWLEVAPPGSATSLALVAASAQQPAGVATGIRLSTSDAAALRDRLGSAGTDVGELLSWPGVPPMFTFADPDGNSLVAVQ
jgi:lactoylglutathione lyase